MYMDARISPFSLSHPSITWNWRYVFSILGLPSYLIFMCIRHMDYSNDDAKLKSFLSSTVNGIKRVVKRFNEDADRITLWLANTCRLLHNLKQYSGEKSLQKENNAKQNEQVWFVIIVAG